MPSASDKMPAAVDLGRRGGRARARNLTAEQRKASAQKAAKARWKGHKKQAKPKKNPP